MDLAKFHQLSEKQQEEILQDYADLVKAKSCSEKIIKREGASTPPAIICDAKRTLNSPETPYNGGPKKVSHFDICDLHLSDSSL